MGPRSPCPRDSSRAWDGPPRISAGPAPPPRTQCNRAPDKPIYWSVSPRAREGRKRNQSLQMGERKGLFRITVFAATMVAVDRSKAVVADKVAEPGTHPESDLKNVKGAEPPR